MRVKIGDDWFECEPGRPVMIELTDFDRENLANMVPEATRYACFAVDEWTAEQRSEWMQAGAMA